MRASYAASSILFATVAAAAGAGQICVPDHNGDGHPLFPGLMQGNERAWLANIAFGDVDGDGDLDALMPSNDHLGLLLNDGDGKFAPPIHARSGGNTVGHAELADVDGDGDLDALAVDWVQGDMAVLLGRGDGTFDDPGLSFHVGETPTSFVVHDFTGDGIADVAAMVIDEGGVAFLDGNGDGTFAPRRFLRVPSLAHHQRDGGTGPYLDASDFDGDGDMDIAVPLFGGAQILINDGRGEFALGETLDAPAIFVRGVEAGDLNGDGHPDLAAAASDPWVMAWLNNGDGTFGAAWGHSIGSRDYGDFLNVALGDVDGDGNLDALIPHRRKTGIPLFRGKGDGTLSEEFEVIGTPWDPMDGHILDLNGDGLVDLGVLSLDSDSVLHVFTNAGGGVFPHPEVAEEGHSGTARSMVAVDLDADGFKDLVHYNLPAAPHLRVMRNDGTGFFEDVFLADLPLDSPQGQDMDLVDLGTDVLEVVVGVNEQHGDDVVGSLWRFPLIGSFELGEPARIEIGTDVSDQQEYADLNGDGFLDVAMWTQEAPNPRKQHFERAVQVWLNNGNGGLEFSQRILLRDQRGNGTGTLEVADFDGDGDIDILANSDEPGQPSELFLLRNDGAGSFTITDVFPLTRAARGLMSDDFDGDGDVDAAVAHFDLTLVDEPYLTILENDGTGGLSVRETYINNTLLPGWSDPQVADVNGDGWPDIVLHGLPLGLTVHLNDGTGSFASRARYTTMTISTAVEVDDFDGDGRTDLLSGGGRLEILRGIACLCPVDLDGDGNATRDDFFLYLDLFAAGDPRADFTGDGTIDATDFFAFLDAFAAGC